MKRISQSNQFLKDIRRKIDRIAHSAFKDPHSHIRIWEFRDIRGKLHRREIREKKSER